MIEVGLPSTGSPKTATYWVVMGCLSSAVGAVVSQPYDRHRPRVSSESPCPTNRSSWPSTRAPPTPRPSSSTPTAPSWARPHAPMDIEYPRPGWVQQDAAAIWTAVRECIDEVLDVGRLPCPRRHRHLQPARDGRGLGARAVAPGRAGRDLAMPSLDGDLRLAARRRASARDPGTDGPAARPGLHRRQMALAARRGPRRPTPGSRR